MSSPFDPPLLYARCWEDAAVLRKGLRVSPGDRVLSIASAGDNSFEILLDDPAAVVMIDRNQTQLALVHLKMAAIRHLAPAQVRGLLGVENASPKERHNWYRAIRPHLPEFAQHIWDAALPVLEAGVADAGKFERYLAAFRRWILPLVQWPGTVAKMCTLSDLSAQRALYDKKWNTWRWRTLFRMFFSRRVMERRGRQREFFDHVSERHIGDVFLGRAEKALVAIPAATNPYLRWILDAANLIPPYLSDEHMPTIAERLDRIDIVEEDLIAHLAAADPGTYAAYNLSDCLEYMPAGVADDMLRGAVRAGREGARLVYWNLLVNRDGSRIDGLEPEPELAETLFKEDRAFFYGRLIVEKVTQSG